MAAEMLCRKNLRYLFNQSNSKFIIFQVFMTYGYDCLTQIIPRAKGNSIHSPIWNFQQNKLQVYGEC